MYRILLGTLILTPSLTQAADGSLQGLIVGVGSLINQVLVPAVLAIAFLVFVVNVVRFFVIGGANEEGQKNAKALALYSVLAFVIILSFWGIVNLLADSVGLNDEPCLNDTMSDYMVTDQAPCTSLRPQARPVGLVQPSPDTTAGDIPGGFGSGSDLTDSDSDVNGSPLESFTPDGTALDYRPVQLAQTAVRTDAAPYFESEIQQDFGYNTNIVLSALFADLYTTPTTLVSDQERIEATYRLTQLGAVDESRLTTYIDELNQYYTERNEPAENQVSLTTIQNAGRPLTSAASSNISSTQALLRSELEAYNTRTEAIPSAQVDVDAVVASVYDPTVTLDERRARLDALYDAEALYIQDPDNTLYERFSDDINMVAVFSGSFDQIQ